MGVDEVAELLYLGLCNSLCKRNSAFIIEMVYDIAVKIIIYAVSLFAGVRISPDGNRFTGFKLIRTDCKRFV